MKPRTLFSLLFATLLAMLAGACSTPEQKPAEPPVGAAPQTMPVPQAAVVKNEGKEQPRTETRPQAERDAAGRADAPLGKLLSAVPAAPAAAAREAFHPGLRLPSEPLDREAYAHYDDNPVKRVAEQPVSTFGADVDTGAYANVRRMLMAGRLPPRDAVRVEEMINYFDYGYARPAGGGAPFRVETEIAPTPWNPNTQLLRIGIQGEDVSRDRLPPANLVFLVDVSGSMQPENKLPLLKSALRLLTQQLRPQDRVSMVVYAGGTGVVLEPTPGERSGAILAAIEALGAGGSTNGAAGIRLAYAMAEKGFVPGGINRVLLATDGDFNVGTVSFEALKDLVAEKRKGGVTLTTLGFGAGNYNDRLMEALADAGNGNYHYIDTLNEARKVLADEMSSTLYMIAKDVKLQIEFNPAQVAEYRLVGYENRVLAREDFANDRVDAGDIGAGHRVTALYEIALRGSGGERIEPLRYRREAESSAKGGEIAFLRLRYKRPQEDASRLLEWPVEASAMRHDAARASGSFRLAAAVAGFGQLLRGGRYTGGFDYAAAARLASEVRAPDPYGYRAELARLIALADALSAKDNLSRAPGDDTRH